MIFLSHTASDKPIVEPIAMRLANLLGINQVFYDAWSIQPGDGIIDKMNEGLSCPSHVFFFVSEASLKSPMVKLEWQNAVYKATKGLTKMIPVRVDGADMPAILMQNLYVDMHSVGFDAAAKQIVDIVSGNNTFTPQHQNFSNLHYSVAVTPEKNIRVSVLASHLPEFNLRFAFVLDNQVGEAEVNIDGAGMAMIYEPSLQPYNGQSKLVLIIADQSAQSIKPKFPLAFKITSLKGASLKLLAVLHEIEPGQFKPLPLSI